MSTNIAKSEVPSRPADPFEFAVYKRVLRMEPWRIRQLASSLKDVPGDVGDELRRGVVHAAADLCASFGHEIMRLYKKPERSILSEQQSRSDAELEFGEPEQGF